MVGDRLTVFRGSPARAVGELVIETVSNEQAMARVVRLVDPARSPVLEHLAVMKGDRVSMTETAPVGVWTPKKKRVIKRRRRRAKPNKAAKPVAKSNFALPPGKGTITVGGRELPTKNPSFSITPAPAPKAAPATAK
jgi:hypothetical protein